MPGDRPTVATIDLSALEANYLKIKAHCQNIETMAVVKANAYGCGLVPCARRLEEAGCKWFGVAFLQEALELRTAGIKARILVLGGLPKENIALYLQNDLDLTASSVFKLDMIEKVASNLGIKARVHLKIDTGFERIGIHYYNAGELLEYSLKTRNCEVVGIYSHFAKVEPDDLSYGKLQLERFLEVCEFFPKHSIPTPTRHIAATPACLYLSESWLDMIRPGLGLYGVLPSTERTGFEPELKPVLNLTSEVVFFKVIPKGAGVSYGLTWTAPTDTRLVTVPIGYGDGYSRALSNKAKCLINGIYYPIVGNICMDQLMVDIGPEGTAYNGDLVTLIGEQKANSITVEELAALLNTTPHEILVSINNRIPRTYV